MPTFFNNKTGQLHTAIEKGWEAMNERIQCSACVRYFLSYRLTENKDTTQTKLYDEGQHDDTSIANLSRDSQKKTRTVYSKKQYVFMLALMNI